MAKNETEKILAFKKMGCTDEEIAEVLETDRRIDQGEKLFELPKELKEGSKKARLVGNTAGYTRTTKKEKPINNDKRFLIDSIVWALSTTDPKVGDNVNADNIKIINPERELTFEYENTKYKIVLSCPRS